MSDLPEYVRRNRAQWDEWAHQYEQAGRRNCSPPAESTTRYDFVTLEWARQWPCEEVWRARKRG